MTEVDLIFPDTSSMAQFILKYKINNVLVNSYDQSLTACLNEEEQEIAIKEYFAVVKPRTFFDTLMEHTRYKSKRNY